MSKYCEFCKEYKSGQKTHFCGKDLPTLETLKARYQKLQSQVMCLATVPTDLQRGDSVPDADWYRRQIEIGEQELAEKREVADNWCVDMITKRVSNNLWADFGKIRTLRRVYMPWNAPIRFRRLLNIPQEFGYSPEDIEAHHSSEGVTIYLRGPELEHTPEVYEFITRMRDEWLEMFMFGTYLDLSANGQTTRVV